ncbi:MAG TPA: cupin domain-containing protein [Burkholderiales bacterium]|nr:cupin domain-containing protein [Burkholderiales bacterium]
MGVLSRSISISVLATLFAAPAMAGDEVFINKGDIKWGAAPPSLAKGAKLAVLYGDPGKSGPFTLRLMAPAGYKIAPHLHSQAEHLTVVSGTFYLGTGDKMDKSHAHALSSGGYHYLPAKAHHYAFTKAATIVQVSGEGPFDIVYLNPADNPEKAAKK